MKHFIFLLFVFTGYNVFAQVPPAIGAVLPTRQVPVHDPVMIKQGNSYYIFCTGFGISVWSSIDLKNWKKEAPVFKVPQQWAVDTIPGFKGHTWAPDISFHNALYYLYYSVSAFGKNTSAIGVATNKTLDPSSKDFEWVDHGRVFQSYPRKNNWNAIDPNLVVVKKGKAYLAFGSFWDGLKLIKMKKDLLHPAEPTNRLPTIARRDVPPSATNPIEAPFIFRKSKYYYLFASINYCCKGENSTYEVIVGRSKKVDGPYVDKDGRNLKEGGGTLILSRTKDWYGVGHNGICVADGETYIVYHGYDAADKGRSKLIIQQLKWDEEGWPVVIDVDESVHP